MSAYETTDPVRDEASRAEAHRAVEAALRDHRALDPTGYILSPEQYARIERFVAERREAIAAAGYTAQDRANNHKDGKADSAA